MGAYVVYVPYWARYTPMRTRAEARRACQPGQPGDRAALP
jgi:hypothetical protein